MAKALDLEELTRLYELMMTIEHRMKEIGEDFSYEKQVLENRLEHLRKPLLGELSPWEKVMIARHQKRPTALDLIPHLFDDYTEMHGDRYFGDDPAISGGIAWFGDEPVTVIAQQKGRNTKENIKRNFGMPNPEGYRKSLRLMKQAEKFGRTVICFVDTPGAYPGVGAEERGQAFAIANNLLEMSWLRVPIITIVIGEGGSGGALALGIGDRVYMLEHAIYSVISPDGAAALLWKDASLAEKAAELLKITAQDLFQYQIIDGIIPEPGVGAHFSLTDTAKQIRQHLSLAIAELHSCEIAELIEQRYEKFMKMVRFTESEQTIASSAKPSILV
ncbi:acetyl-CoA carboxylase carboxyltransferase subunit alpha [Brevibacillus fulvus]|uniref:Acetyl-coenzyme A carboxylase carboxyl transferase subunit alpha n=1 Tax=Brevibacillus fulvus TaxID=1125967 RepID=A0A939BRK7_9BACL|nr:acetyl-CoA carboxylase carboxyltransferase subunit alpha [Brevibacillus fulvus]MBM7589563.1 acetyl-CoA carboxylase carboxyl transferase subunit alpha [Brevibacillus fulvus]